MCGGEGGIWRRGHECVCVTLHVPSPPSTCHRALTFSTVNLSIGLGMGKCVLVHACDEVSVCLYVCMLVGVYMCACVCMCVCECAHICMCVCV